MDEDGYFYVVDRLKDMINVSGFKVYPAEVENVLYKHPAVAEAAVYGVPHPVRGETVKAHIVCRPDHSLTEQKIISFCREKMAVYKAPRAVEFVNSIPKNAPGKVLKRVIRQADLREQEQN
jgi:long-chain acyl-CoA synthetase